MKIFIRNFPYLAVGLLALPLQAGAQDTCTGRVIDRARVDPLPLFTTQNAPMGDKISGKTAENSLNIPVSGCDDSYYFILYNGQIVHIRRPNVVLKDAGFTCPKPGTHAPGAPNDVGRSSNGAFDNACPS